jgi:hypothetical protein
VPIHQDSHWLGLKRLRLYSRTAALVFSILAIGLVFHSNIVDPNGFPLVFDFGVFWGAAHLALSGHPADAYQIAHLQSVVKMIIPIVTEGSYGWFYPPNFFLIISPLALLPYLYAYLVFMVLTLAAYVLVVQRVIPGRDALWCLAGFSGAWVNLLLGQNAFLTAALAGAALMQLGQRPVLAGVLIGFLSIKPQLALLFPVVLVAMGAWRTFLVAAVVGLSTMLAATTILGIDVLTSWWESLGLAKVFLEVGGTGYWMKMPTVFAFLRILGAPIAVSYWGHAFIAAGAIGAVWKIWRSCTDVALRNAALMTGTFLVSPYLFEYDLAWLALPIAWMAKIGLTQGWLRWEREILILSWLLPLTMMVLARTLPIQIGPWVLMALLAMILRRARVTTASGAA